MKGTSVVPGAAPRDGRGTGRPLEQALTGFRPGGRELESPRAEPAESPVHSRASVAVSARQAAQIGRFRCLLGEDGIEHLLRPPSSALSDIKAVKPADLERVIVDATVQSKAIAHPAHSRQLEIARHTMNKLYALHAPEAECISKGKARNPYEFGVKVSLVVTHKQGLMVGARSFPGNPCDGHCRAPSSSRPPT